MGGLSIISPPGPSTFSHEVSLFLQLFARSAVRPRRLAPACLSRQSICTTITIVEIVVTVFQPGGRKRASRAWPGAGDWQNPHANRIQPSRGLGFCARRTLYRVTTTATTRSANSADKAPSMVSTFSPVTGQLSMKLWLSMFGCGLFGSASFPITGWLSARSPRLGRCGATLGAATGSSPVRGQKGGYDGHTVNKEYPKIETKKSEQYHEATLR